MNVPAEKLPETPAGSPDTVAPVALPPIVYVMLERDDPSQISWLSVPGADESVMVGNGETVMVPLNVAGAQLPPELVTV